MSVSVFSSQQPLTLTF